MPFIVGQLVANLTVDGTSFDRALDKALRQGNRAAGEVSRRWARIGNQFNAIGKQLTVGVTAPLGVIGATATSEAIRFESSFAGVRKTVEGTAEEVEALRQGLRDLAAGPAAIPVDVNELARIAEMAGSLGIASQDILKFTRVVAELKEAASDLNADQAATGLAQFAGIMGTPISQASRLSSTIVDLGNKTKTTEGKILDFGLQIAGTAKVLGITEAQTLGIAAAFSSLGIEVEAGGSAVQNVLLDMQRAVAGGGDALQSFARIATGLAGQSDAFAQRFRSNAGAAFNEFVVGLGKLNTEDAVRGLDELGQANVRTLRALLSAAGAGDELARDLDIATEAWKANTAAATEAQRRFETTESKLKLAKNGIRDAQIEIGNKLTPTLLIGAKAASGFASAIAAIPPGLQATALAVGALAASVGPLSFVFGQALIAGSRLLPMLTAVRASLGLLGAAEVAKSIAKVGRVVGFAPAAAQTATAIQKAAEAAKVATPSLLSFSTSLHSAFAVAPALSASLVGLAGALGVIAGTKLRPFVEDLIGLNGALGVAFGLFAKPPKALDVAAIMGDPEEAIRAVELFVKLRKKLAQLGEEFEVDFSRVRTDKDEARKLAEFTEILSRRQHAVVTAAETERQVQAGLSAETAAVNAKRAAEIDELIRHLEVEVEVLKLGADGQALYTLAANKAGEADRARVEGLLAQKRAIGEKTEAERKAAAAAESNRAAVENQIQGLDDQIASLQLTGRMLALYEAATRGATAAELASINGKLRQIQALTDQADAEQRAQQIIERSLTIAQRHAIELAEIEDLRRKGQLTESQYAAAVAEVNERLNERADAERRAQEIMERSANLADRRAEELQEVEALHAQGVLTARQHAAAVAEIDARYDELADRARDGHKTLEELGKQAARNIQDAFADFLFDPFDEGVKGMVQGFLNAIRRMLAEALAAQVLRALLGGTSVGDLLGFAQGGQVPAMARGGRVTGAGSSTGDSVIARLSPGEYVMNANAVSRFGVGFFDKLNAFQLALPRFAHGGMVGGPMPAMAGGPTIHNTYNIDARGAQKGVGEEIRRAIRESEDRAVRRSVVEVGDRTSRGGSFARVIRG